MSAVVRSLLQTDTSSTRFLQRIALAVVIFPHGAQKLFGWFGGSGFGDTIRSSSAELGIAPALAVLVMLAETLGSVALALGALTRIAAFGISAVMVGAIAFVHAEVGFFMDWSGTGAGQGFEYHLLALALGIPLIVWGGGRYAVDRALLKQTINSEADPRDPEVVGRRVTAEESGRV